MNEKLGLPTAKMVEIPVFFDVDGTLRCSCTPNCAEPNERIVSLVRILGNFKNVKLYVWSGGGADYANRFVQLFKLESYVPKHRVFSKMDPAARILALRGIVIDDIQDTALGAMNLIVREK